MRRPRLGVVLVLVCVLVYLMVLKWHYDSHNALPRRPPLPVPKAALAPDWLAGSGERIQFGIMFDAGSTGTRVHVFKFRLEQNHSFPQLLEENFKSISPGLSSFAEDPPQCRAGLLQLLDSARTIVPEQLHRTTPLFLKATAGLRLLQEEQAQRLLDQVKAVFRESPFFSSDQNVSILDGAEEGVSAWLTVNFLLGAVGGGAASVGILDLGGGSTQVTFSPRSKWAESLSSDLTTLRVFSSNCTLYTHSYLGLGLMEARTAVFGKPTTAAGSVLQACSERVRTVMKDTVRVVEQQHNFSAFSFYYDRAVDIQAIDADSGGSVLVKDFSSAAHRVCAGQVLQQNQSPFLCLDLVYITVLLQELGFKPHSELQLRRWIGGVETSWALGATLTNMNFTHFHQS